MQHIFADCFTVYNLLLETLEMDLVIQIITRDFNCNTYMVIDICPDDFVAKGKYVYKNCVYLVLPDTQLLIIKWLR